jgi:CBS domain containing-hemolysin-like protein
MTTESVSSVLAAIGGAVFSVSAAPVGLAALRRSAGGIPISTALLVVTGSLALLLYSVLDAAAPASLTASYALTLACWFAAVLPWCRRQARHTTDE